MGNQAKLAELSAHIADDRARAAHARQLADQVNDAIEHHSLLRHAEQLDLEAEELEMQVMVLKEAAQASEAESDLAASEAA